MDSCSGIPHQVRLAAIHIIYLRKSNDEQQHRSRRRHHVCLHALATRFSQDVAFIRTLVDIYFLDTLSASQVAW